MTLILMGVGIVALIIFIRFVVTNTKSRTDALRAVFEVRLDQLDGLVQEAIHTLKTKMKIDIDLNHAEDAAQQITFAFSRLEVLKSSFSKPDAENYFMTPMGALVGEYLVRHRGGAWITDSSEAAKEMGMQPAPAVDLHEDGGSSPFRTHPFLLMFLVAFNQSLQNNPIDIYQYLTRTKECDADLKFKYGRHKSL